MNARMPVRRLLVAEVALVARRHPVTIRRALEAGTLHGTQRVTRGTWTVREDCLEAWCDGKPCAHQSNVVQLFPAESERVS